MRIWRSRIGMSWLEVVRRIWWAQPENHCCRCLLRAGGGMRVGLLGTTICVLVFEEGARRNLGKGVIVIIFILKRARRDRIENNHLKS